MPPVLDPLKRLFLWHSRTGNSGKLYGAIVAQARLPVFYQSLGVPDTLEGRFALLALHLFAVLHRLRGEGTAAAHRLSQALMDHFSQDMDTVLREMGVSDLRVPKKMRGLAAASGAVLEDYEARFSRGDKAFAAAIEAALPASPAAAGLSSEPLAAYVRESVKRMEQQSIAALETGRVEFAQAPNGHDPESP